MKLSEQICNLELSKRLKELGVKQNSFFWHYQDRFSTNPNYGEAGWKNPQEAMPWKIEHYQPSKISGSRVLFEYAAFTAAELGELLPMRFATIKQPNGYIPVEFEPIIGETRYSDFIDKNEANSRARMLIWLIENRRLEYDYNIPWQTTTRNELPKPDNSTPI